MGPRRPPSGSFPGGPPRGSPESARGSPPGPRHPGGIDRNPHHASAGLSQGGCLGHGRREVGGPGGTHALNHDRTAAADGDRANAYRPGGISTSWFRHSFPFCALFPSLTDFRSLRASEVFSAAHNSILTERPSGSRPVSAAKADGSMVSTGENAASLPINPPRATLGSIRAGDHTCPVREEGGELFISS